jgi:hypothetical protein
MQVQYVSPSWVKGGLIFLCQHPKSRVSQRIGVDLNDEETTRFEWRFEDALLSFINTSSLFSRCFPIVFQSHGAVRRSGAPRRFTPTRLNAGDG